jgi:hypothetical protein
MQEAEIVRDARSAQARDTHFHGEQIFEADRPAIIASSGNARPAYFHR